VILEERLSDGSDTGNPAADHRALFLGEDGALHLRDSAGTITAVGGGIADQGAFTYLDATEGAAPGTPASGKARIYAKSDGRIYSKDDAGVEYGPFSSGGGGSLSAYPTAILALSPVAYWRLNETETARAAFDSTENLLHAGQIGGAIMGNTAIPAAALIVGDATAGSFDFQPNSVLEADDNALLDLGDVFSITAVIRPDSVSGQKGILAKGSGAYYVRTNGTNLELVRAGTAVIVASTGITLATATVYHIVVTKNGATVKLWINGVDRTGSVSDSTMVDTTNVLTIGGQIYNSELFDGRIAEVALFSTALSSTNVGDLFTASGL
jgi:hypothetical protein